MRTRIVVRALADAQFAEAHNRLNLSRRGRGDEFLLAVDERLEVLANFPFSCEIDFDDVRKAQIKGFPYLLLYLLRDFADERRLIIVACVYERSDPQTWRKLN